MTRETERTFGAVDAAATNSSPFHLLAGGLKLGALRTSSFWLILGLIGTPFTAGITLIIAICIVVVQLAIGAPIYFFLGRAALHLEVPRTPLAMACIAAVSVAIPLLAAAAILLPYGPSGTPFTDALVVGGPVALLTAPIWGHALGQVCTTQKKAAAQNTPRPTSNPV